MNTSLLVRSGPTESERIAAALAHAGTCVAWFFAPLIVYLIERDRSEFARSHALQALLWSGLGTIVGAVTCGLAIPLFMIVHVCAAVRAWEGRDYDYPFVSDVARRLSR